MPNKTTYDHIEQSQRDTWFDKYDERKKKSPEQKNKESLRALESALANKAKNERASVHALKVPPKILKKLLPKVGEQVWVRPNPDSAKAAKLPRTLRRILKTFPLTIVSQSSFYMQAELANDLYSTKIRLSKDPYKPHNTYTWVKVSEDNKGENPLI